MIRKLIVQRLLNVALIVVVLMPLAVTASCASNPGHELKMASMNMLSAPVQNAPTRVREAYQFALANPDVLKNVPCYCGCGAIGHTSDYSCYVKEARADGTFVLDEHALGCSLCVDIAQDVMQKTRDGRSPPEIRADVIATFSRYGPPNQPVP